MRCFTFCARMFIVWMIAFILPVYGKDILLHGGVDGYEIVACIGEDDGKLYVINAAEKESLRSAIDANFFKPNTQLIARASVHKMDIFSGIWQIAQEGSCCVSGIFGSLPKEPLYDWMKIDAINANKWQGMLHYHSSKYIDKKWREILIDFEKIDDDCASFERWRLSLPWQHFLDYGGKIKELKYRSTHVNFKFFIHPVTEVVFTELEPNQFLSPRKATKINRRLRELASKMNMAWSKCEEYDANLTLVADSSRLAVFEKTEEGYCGATHPYEGADIYSFDLKTGVEIDYKKWFISDNSKNNFFPKELWRLLMKSIENKIAEDQPDCVQRMKETKDFTPWISLSGMEFRFSEDVRSLIICRGDYRLSFKAVRKFIKSERVKDFDAIVKSLAAAR